MQIEPLAAACVQDDVWAGFRDDTADRLREEIVMSTREEFSTCGNGITIIPRIARPFLIGQQKVEVSFPCTIKRVVLSAVRDDWTHDQGVVADRACEGCVGVIYAMCLIWLCLKI